MSMGERADGVDKVVELLPVPLDGRDVVAVVVASSPEVAKCFGGGFGGPRPERGHFPVEAVLDASGLV